MRNGAEDQAHAGALPPVQFDGVTPEQKAAVSLKTFFTMVAVRIVLDHVRTCPHLTRRESLAPRACAAGASQCRSEHINRVVQIPLGEL